MGQTYTDYLKASKEAAHLALKKLHEFDDSLTPTQREQLKGFVVTLSQCNQERVNKPRPHGSELTGVVVEVEATSGNLTAFTRMRKLAEARPSRDKDTNALPFPFSENSIIPKVLANLLADLDERAPGKQVVEDLFAGNETDFEAILGRALTKEEAEAVSSGKLRALSFDGFLNKKLNKRYGFMGSGFLAINAWNDSYSGNKWALHVHADGGIVAEYIEVTNHIKKSHI